MVGWEIWGLGSEILIDVKDVSWVQLLVKPDQHKHKADEGNYEGWYCNSGEIEYYEGSN